MFETKFESELNYWDNELTLKGVFPEAIKNRMTPGRMSLEFPIYIIRQLDEIKELFKRTPRVLDLGSGPLSQLAYGHDIKILNLHAVDPLADEYKKLLKKHNIPKQKYNLIQCEGEKLTEKFSENYFDFVWIHNALDHTQDPIKTFSEMVKVARPGAYIYVQGWENEGTKNGFYGLHQHDISWDNDTKELKVKSYGEKIKSIYNELPIDLFDYFCQTYDNKRKWIKAVWKKK